MKKLLVAITMAVLFLGCGKSHKPEVQPTPPDIPVKNYSNKIVLNEAKLIGDSLNLSWSKLDTPNLMTYTLMRKDNSNAQMISIKQYLAKDKNSIFDSAVPYSPSVQYQVVGNLSSGLTISSNIITHSRPDIKAFDINPFDVLYSDKDNLLYFFEKTGKISIYDIQKSQIIKSINTDATIGYCDFGVYNNKKELYVPRTDGWIFVYDAVTLEKITQISIGLSASCIVFNNNNLFVSTAAWTQRPIKVYNRANGKKISETGDFELTRFKKVPNTNTELLEITINIGPVDQDHYSFAADGTFMSHQDDIYHGDYPLDAGIFEIFPDGSKYITSSSGSIYNRSMTYEASLPRGNLNFNCFALTQADQLIYAGCQNKNIEVYTMNSYNRVKTIKTNGYPFRIFDYQGKILSVSKTSKFDNTYYNNNASSQIVIELLNK
jgi:hypothetical protein